VAEVQWKGLKMSYLQCQRRLAVIWFIGACLVALIPIARTLAGETPVVTASIWRWLLPNLMPTLSLIIGAVTITKPTEQKSADVADSFSFRLAELSSVFYLLLVLALVALPPMLQPSTDQAEFLGNSGLFMGPIQGIVSALIGVFFIKQRQRAE
jgi:hypothetical protein